MENLLKRAIFFYRIIPFGSGSPWTPISLFCNEFTPIFGFSFPCPGYGKNNIKKHHQGGLSVFGKKCELTAARNR